MADSKHQRKSGIQWIRLGDLRVSPKAQRELRKAHAEAIAADFDLEALGYPVVSRRDDHYWLLDGQHRVEALKIVGFADTDRIECEVYDNLTEADDAELFLRRDQRKAISKFDAFRIAVTAGRQKERHIERLVQAEGYKISRGPSAGSIAAVSALRFAYAFGSDTLTRTLRILGTGFEGDRSAFGEQLIKGMALVCQRYDGSLDDDAAVQRLGGLVGGPNTIMRKASTLQLKTGHTKPHCVAAAIVDTLNARQGGRKLESWWK